MAGDLITDSNFCQGQDIIRCEYCGSIEDVEITEMEDGPELICGPCHWDLCEYE